MLKRKLQSALVASLLLASNFANAAFTTVSTGDLGYNVISNSGLYEVSLFADSPSNSFASSIDVKYGLWNSPDVSVSVFLNSWFLGSMIANAGYISPGPAFASFDVTGHLVNGLNTISFNGFGANSGDYVVGQVDLHYNSIPSVPEPESWVLITLGLGLIGIRKKIQG